MVCLAGTAGCADTAGPGPRHDGALSPLGTLCPDPSPSADLRSDGVAALARINHFVIIYLENHSFDNLYGLFPGADGVLDEQCRLTTPLQVDEQGRPYERLPNPPPTSGNGSPFDDLPNRPFLIDPLLPADRAPPDLTHAFFTQQAQINGGAMNQFAAFSSTKSFSLGVYDSARLPLAKVVAGYTLCDHFFQSAFGGSFLNHMWLVAARTPEFPGLPDNADISSALPGATKPFPVNADGVFTGEDRTFTADGYAVNNAHTVNVPHAPSDDPAFLLPGQTAPTIGDRLTAAGQSWAWYSGGWDEIIAFIEGGADGPPLSAEASSFQYHHQPFAYFAAYKEGTPARAEHLKDERDFLSDAASGRLPAVSFVKPTGLDDEHPGYTDLARGEEHAAALIEAVMKSPQWSDSAIIVTYDENGGFADHVAPPVIDRWGPGTRIPALVISPYARKHFIDHTTYETVSILSTLERRFGLAPLTARDAAAHDLTPAFSLED